MYQVLLWVHNILAWLVLATGIFVLVRAATNAANWSEGDTGWVRRLTLFVHLQLVAGLALWFTSPAVATARASMGETMRDGSLRRLVVEHPTLMLAAAIVATVSSVKVRKATSAHARARTALIGTLITMLLIAAVIPWARLVTVWTEGM
jgi:uncharacterized membrane protein